METYENFPSLMILAVYVDSAYFIATTITTVGYGDISALSGSIDTEYGL